MKAIVYEKYGPPEVAQLKEVSLPKPLDNELLIKVMASTVNRTDSGFRSAEYFVSRFWSGLFTPKLNVLGCEFAGEIEAIGKDVKTSKKGDKVFGFNESKFGAHAEYMTIPEHGAVTTLPKNVTFEEATPICEGGHYALCDIRVANVKAGQNVLANGATGAIGSAAVQLLKYFGAKVIAVCETKNVNLIKSIGADLVIDYTKTDFTKTDVRYDFIFDAVGKSSFGKCRPILKEKGIYLSTEPGKNGENIFFALFTPFFGGKKVLFPIPSINKTDVIFLKQLVENKEFMPIIDRKYTFDEIVEAYKYVETGKKIGNVVLKINEY